MAKTRVTKKGKIKVQEKDIEKALRVSKTKRKKRTIRLYALFAILILVFLFTQLWESKEEEELREMVMDLTPAIRVDETSTNIQEGSSVDALDKGTDCLNHDYILSPGAAELLRFEVKLEREALQLANRLKDKVEYDDIALEHSFLKWEEQAISAEVQSYDLENITGKTNVWIVQAGELIEAYQKAPQTAARTSGNLDKIDGFIAKKTRFTVDFIDDNYGVISTLGRYYYTEAKVGELVEVDITAKLGGALMLPYVYEGKKYELPVEKREVEKVVYFLNLDVSLNLQDSYDQDVVNSESNFAVKIKDAPDIKFTLKLNYSKKDNEFHILGPAISSDCYKKIETQ